MDIKERQIGSEEQEVILRTFAEASSRPGCQFLEIGSWCGDSTLILGKVAQANRGHLFCIDWWKGNKGTELEKIASQTDIFSFFWKRICDQRLQDVVIPIRARSDVALKILKSQSFDLIYLDGDHRYGSILKDIQRCKSLVRENGIMCGDDCEGRMADFDPIFLDKGKHRDFYQSAHCGVILAVGKSFREFSIDYSIWSVRASRTGRSPHKWQPTHFSFPGLLKRRQLPPSPIGLTSNHILYQYEDKVYATPRGVENFDITDKQQRSHPELVVADSTQAMEELIHEKIYSIGIPHLVEPYRGHNIVEYGGLIYAVSQAVGPLDLSLEEERKRPEVMTASSRSELEKKIDAVCDLLDPPILLESYKEYNLVRYGQRIYALSQFLGPLDLRQEAVRDLLTTYYQKKGTCFIGNSVEEIKSFIEGRKRSVIYSS